MVKEGSLPLARVGYAFIDLCIQGEKQEAHDRSNLLVQGIYSIAMFMIEHHIPMGFIWYDRERDVIHEEVVEREEELLWMFQELFRCKKTHNESELIDRYLAWEKGTQLENAMYLTVCDHGDLENTGLVRERLEVMDLRVRGDEFEDQE